MSFNTQTGPFNMIGALADRPVPPAPGLQAGYAYFATDGQGGACPWIFDGTQWLQLTCAPGSLPLQTYVLDPSGTIPGSHTTFTSLYTSYALGEGPAVIIVAGDATVPAGSYPLRPFTSWQAATDSQDPTVLTMANGAVFVDFLAGGVLNGLVVSSNSATPCFTRSTTTGDAAMVLDNYAALRASGASPMLDWTQVGSTGSLQVYLRNGAALRNSGSQVISFDGAPGDNAEVVLSACDGTFIDPDTLTSGVNATAVVQPLAVTATIGAQPNYTGTGTPFVAPTVVANSAQQLADATYTGGTVVIGTDKSTSFVLKDPAISRIFLTSNGVQAVTLNDADLPVGWTCEFWRTDAGLPAHTFTPSAGTINNAASATFAAGAIAQVATKKAAGVFFLA